MKRIKILVVLAVAVCTTMLAAAPLFAQEWSAEQKEVWKNVEAYWELWKAQDLEGFLSYAHKEFLGWSYDSPLPSDMASRMKWVKHYLPKTKIVLYEIRPVGIGVYGNVAIAHYYYDVLTKDSEGKDERDKGRWTDVLMKQGDKWVVIGDHGGSLSEK